MIELWKLHWLFIRQPKVAIRDHIPTWPVTLGIVLASVNLASQYLANGRTLALIHSAFSVAFGISDLLLTLAILAVVTGIAIAIDYYFYPWLVRRFLTDRPEQINDTLVRQIHYYSATSSLVFVVYVVLPVNTLQVVFAAFFAVETWSLVLITISSLVVLWHVVPLLNGLVIRWVGYREQFGLSTSKLLLLVFVAPIVSSLPVILVLAPTFWSFVTKSMH